MHTRNIFTLFEIAKTALADESIVSKNMFENVFL